MSEDQPLHDRWLVAAWPGMGSVALGAGYYLLAKLGMHLLDELPARELFDRDHVDVTDVMIQVAPLPRSRLFCWKDPQQRHDLIVFLQRIVSAIHEAEAKETPELPEIEPAAGKKPRLEAADRQHIAQLFTEAAKDRSRAYFLKQELDRLHVFPDYEDRFLDLFKEPGPP